MSDEETLYVSKTSRLAREADIEKRLRIEAVALGGLLMKWVCPGNDGVPDRILLLDHCPVVFVEVKRVGEKLEPLQEYWARTFRGMGFEVWAPIDSVEDFAARAAEWKSRHAAEK